jgi:hypothetical protein
MFKKHLAAALSALLTVAVCAPCATAQSGRRFSRASGDNGFVTLTGEQSGAGREAGEGTRKEFDLRDLNTSKSGPVVYAEDGEKHPNKADKIAGGILLGYLVLCLVIMAKSDDGFALSSDFNRGAGLRR